MVEGGEPGEVLVLQVSDTHLTADPDGARYDRSPDAMLARTVAAVRSRGLRPDLVLLTGDDADDASPAAYDRLAHALDVLGAPVLAIAGNHDEPGRVAAAFPRPTTVELGRWRVVGVDTSRPGRVDGEVHVAAALEALDVDARPTVLAVHHPPRSPSTHLWFGLEHGDELLAALATRPHVRAVVSGHLHQAFSLAHGPLQLLGCPSTLVAMRHDGATYAVHETGVTGARLLRLGRDGSLVTEVVADR